MTSVPNGAGNLKTYTGVAVIGSANIGTDLLIKIERMSTSLKVLAVIGIDPQSDGLARARELGIATTAQGISFRLSTAPTMAGRTT